MIIQKLRLQRFRCFQDEEFTFDPDASLVIIEGPNGIGKSSLLEALHYSCYLRSFRTHLNKEIMQLGSKHFFASIEFEQELTQTQDQMQVGFSDEQGKLVKLNKKPIKSYKELISYYRIVTLHADNLLLVHGAPEHRRSFMNYSLFLENPEVTLTLKQYKQVVDQRNKLLSNFELRYSSSFSDQLSVWSEKLWTEMKTITELRVNYLHRLEQRVNSLLEEFFFGGPDGNLRVTLSYQPKAKFKAETFDSFWQQFNDAGRAAQELKLGRGLFGTHLDDLIIEFQQKKARVFASRGQQKLIVFLLKLAQLQLTNKTGEPGVLLLDDFMTDFDTDRLGRCLKTLKQTKSQVFVTCPSAQGTPLETCPDTSWIRLKHK